MNQTHFELTYQLGIFCLRVGQANRGVELYLDTETAKALAEFILETAPP